jgi:sporulation protein YlmC with PRC-barrel domain
MSGRTRMLNTIKEGMKVYDNKGGEIGTVEYVHFSEADGGQHPVAAVPSNGPTEPDLVDLVQKMFGADKLPRELRERLLMNGFIKMDSAKLFGSDRYVMFDQITKVDPGGVYIGVEDSDNLLKA